MGRRRANHETGSASQPDRDLRLTLAGDENISEKRRTDPRLRPFVVAMANAIIKDMLREQKEGSR
jgi:hypothetical protein